MGLEAAQQRADHLLEESLDLLTQADLATPMLTSLALQAVKRRY